MEILSLWRSPLDKVALREAELLQDRQPRCSTSIAYDCDFEDMSIYNFGYWYLLEGKNASTALSTMLGVMASPSATMIASGGLAFIPQQAFTVSATPAGYSVPDQCQITGSGGGGLAGSNTFYHFTVTPYGDDTQSYLFNCVTSGHTSGGVYFCGLAFEWGNSPTPTSADTCIYASVWNCQAVDCNFVNCPVAFNAQANSCGLVRCTIQYQSGSPANATMVILGAVQTFVIGPSVFMQDTLGDPTGCTAIAVENGTEHVVVSNMHISSFDFGINYSLAGGATKFGHFSKIECDANQRCVYMMPPGSDGTIFGDKYESCTFSLSADSTYAESLFYIGTNGGANKNVSDIELDNLTIYQGLGHGLEINTGQNIRVIGGMYSGNGTASAGVAITGACGDVTILGANLRPKYDNAQNVRSQLYALEVSGSPAGTVTVDSCDMYGYSGSPVSVTGAIASNGLFITNCHGYNDVGTALNGGVPPVGSGQAVSAATCSTPYFGPSLFMFTNSTPVTVYVFGQGISMNSGIIFLPSPYDSFYFSGAPLVFQWIGK